jgi:hypothetical protein
VERGRGEVIPRPFQIQVQQPTQCLISTLLTCLPDRPENRVNQGILVGTWSSTLDFLHLVHRFL